MKTKNKANSWENRMSANDKKLAENGYIEIKITKDIPNNDLIKSYHKRCKNN